MLLSEVTFGCYPRDDVFYRWVKDGRVREGTATISTRRDDGSLDKIYQIALGDLDPFHPEGETGDEFVVGIEARFDDQEYRRQVMFVSTSDEDDLYISAVGPGAVPEPGTGLFKKTRYSGFVFGVMVLGATTLQGTRVIGKTGALIEHGPEDGVRP